MRLFHSKTFRQKKQIISTSHMVAVRWRGSSKKNHQTQPYVQLLAGWPAVYFIFFVYYRGMSQQQQHHQHRWGSSQPQPWRGKHTKNNSNRQMRVINPHTRRLYNCITHTAQSLLWFPTENSLIYYVTMFVMIKWVALIIIIAKHTDSECTSLFTGHGCTYDRTYLTICVHL